MSNQNSSLMRWTEMGLVPDTAIRTGIRRLLLKRLTEVSADNLTVAADDLNRFVAEMNASVVAPVPQSANEQHYELPAEFFTGVLGQHRKYSACFWQHGNEQDLDRAEADALRITCERAEIENGMKVLDLGCGWGSLSLWIAERYPDCRITSVSNSAGQRQFIEHQAQKRGLGNLQVVTSDMNFFAPHDTFDRIVSVEMFEHMRNYKELFKRIHSWLNPDGHFFMHIFCHRHCAYAFEDKGRDDWMSRYFFTGGIMPSVDLPLRFQEDLKIRQRWIWDGRHYEKTSNAWLRNMDMSKDKLIPVLEQTYGEAEAHKWFMRWRMFFMACAELFGHADGQEWFVGHYLFERGSQVE